MADRDLALFDTAIDSEWRGCDVLEANVMGVMAFGQIRELEAPLGEVSVARPKVSLADVDDLGDLARVARDGLWRQRPGTISSSAPCPLPTVPGARVTAPFDPHVSVRNTVRPRSFAQRHADRIGAAIVARPDSSTALPNRLRMAQACTVLQLNVRIEMFFWNHVE